jgi:hypothetical protein
MNNGSPCDNVIPFSFEEYEQIIKNIGSYLKTFKEIDGEPDKSHKWVVIRHDVEFSIDRAYDLAIFEKQLGIRTIYLFQINSNCYNSYSEKNIGIIRNMFDMGHDIGLHVYLPNVLKNDLPIDSVIESQIALAEEIIGIPFVAFSYHRPPKNLLSSNIIVNGKINCYAPEFFTFLDRDSKKIHQNNDILYLSDSRHQWNYGYPDPETIKKYERIQILMHPYSWTRNGGNAVETFSSLIEEKHKELITSIDQECKHFSSVKHIFER